MTKNNLFQPIYLLFLKKYHIFYFFYFYLFFLFNIYIILSFCHYKNKNVDISRVTAILGVKISDKTMTKTN